MALKFTFIGDGDDPESIVMYGYTFNLGGPAVEVEDENVIRKLSGNRNFAQGEAQAAEAVDAPKRKPGRPKKAPVMQQLSESDLDAE